MQADNMFTWQKDGENDTVESVQVKCVQSTQEHWQHKHRTSSFSTNLPVHQRPCLSQEAEFLDETRQKS